VGLKKLIAEGQQLLARRPKVTHVVTHNHDDGRAEHNSSFSHKDKRGHHFHYHIGTLTNPDGSGESYALNTQTNGQQVKDGAGHEVYRRRYEKGTFDSKQAHKDTLKALKRSFAAQGDVPKRGDLKRVFRG